MPLSDKDPESDCAALNHEAPHSPLAWFFRPEIAWLWIALAVLAVYWPVVGFDFVWDDKNLIVNNPYLAQPGTAWRAFDSDFWELTNSAHASGMYRPLVTLSYWLEYRIWGVAPGGYHATNLLLHMAISILVWSIARRHGLQGAGALFAGLVFALHPVQVDAVSSIASRTDLLATLFALLAALLWWRDPQKGFTTIAALGLLLAAHLSKESSLVAAGVIFLLTPRKTHWPRPTARDATLAIPLVAYFAMRSFALGSALPAASATQEVSWQGPLVVLRYVSRLIWPGSISPIVSWPSPAVAEIVAASVVLLLLAATLWRILSWTPLRACAAAFCVALLPVSEMIPIGARFVDLLLYLPMVCVALGLGLWIEKGRDGCGRVNRRVAACFLALLVVSAAVASQRSFIWRDNTSLWQHGVLFDAGNPRISMNYANALKASGRQQEGCVLLESTIVIAAAHQDEEILAKAHYNLGNCALAAKRFEKAAGHYRIALTISHGGIRPAYKNLALSLVELGEQDAALAVADRYVAEAPGLADAWELRGAVLMTSGRVAEAEPNLQRALALRSPGVRKR